MLSSELRMYYYFADSVDCTSLSFVRSVANLNVFSCFSCATLGMRGYRMAENRDYAFFDTSVAGKLWTVYTWKCVESC